MTRVSLLLYGGYLILNGLLLVSVPGFAFPLVGLVFEGDPWIRVVGILAIEIGVYFVVVARRELADFYWLSVFGRLGVGAGFIALVVLGAAPLQLLLFAVVDICSALWTAMTLRSRSIHQGSGN